MSAATLPYQFDISTTHAEIRFLPGLNAVPWADVEKIGTEVLEEVKQRPSPAYVIDLSPLDYMGSAVVALIVRIWKAVKQQDRQVAVICQHQMVLQVISMAGLDKVWTVVSTREAALKVLGVKVTPSSPVGIIFTTLAVVAAMATMAGVGLGATQQVEGRLLEGLVYGGGGAGVLLGLLSCILSRGSTRWIGGVSVILSALSVLSLSLQWF